MRRRRTKEGRQERSERLRQGSGKNKLIGRKKVEQDSHRWTKHQEVEEEEEHEGDNSIRKLQKRKKSLVRH